MRGNEPGGASGADRTVLDKLADLLLVQQVFESLEDSQDRQAFLDGLVRRIVQLGNIQLCSLMLADDAGDLAIAAACGLPEEVVEKTRVAAGEGIAGHVFASGRALLVDDIQQDPRFSPAPGLVSYDTRSLLSVPLVCRGKKLGVLNVNNKRDGRPFTEADRYLLTGVAQQAALAIENFDLISTLQHQARDLETAHAELQAFAAGRSRLVCNLSHELKTPLASVLGYLELILEHLEELGLEEQRAYLERAREEGERMKELVSGMLLLFTLDGGGGRWEAETIDFAGQVRARLAEWRARLADREIELAVTIPDRPLLVDADPERLAGLVTALFDNALRFNPAGGRLVVDLACEPRPGGEQLCWRLQNCGAKAPAEAWEMIDRSSPLDELHSAMPSGVGVGLSVCKAIVARLEGTIDLEAHPGAGTAIVVRIPLVNQSGDMQ